MNIVRNERNRYIIFKIINEGILSIDHSDILKSIWKSIWHFFGMKEANKIGLWLIEIDLENKFGIIRCCLLYTSPSPRDRQRSRMPSSA